MSYDEESGLYRGPDGGRAMYGVDTWALFEQGDTTPLVVLEDGDLLNTIALHLVKQGRPIVKRKVRLARVAWRLDMLCDEVTPQSIEDKGLKGTPD